MSSSLILGLLVLAFVFLMVACLLRLRSFVREGKSVCPYCDRPSDQEHTPDCAVAKWPKTVEELRRLREEQRRVKTVWFPVDFRPEPVAQWVPVKVGPSRIVFQIVIPDVMLVERVFVLPPVPRNLLGETPYLSHWMPTSEEEWRDECSRSTIVQRVYEALNYSYDSWVDK